MTPKKALGGLSPYTVVTGLQPRGPLANVLQDVNGETVSPDEYVKELLNEHKHLWKVVSDAQELRGEDNRRRAERRTGAGQQIAVGDHVLIRQEPEKLRRETGRDVSVRLLPRTGSTVYRCLLYTSDAADE